MGVFDPLHGAGWERWRDRKLAGRPAGAADLLVEVEDPDRLTPVEHAAMLDRLRRANMVVYACRRKAGDAGAVRRLAARFGLRTLDANLLSEADGLTRITVDPAKSSAGYIPYTASRMAWHTDGYYNEPPRRIRAMLLHCVRPAREGGDTALLDPELAWLRLREEDAGLVDALMAPDALTIPARLDEDGIARPEVAGPVFAIEAEGGDLHMRYTARRRSIRWKADPGVARAVSRLEAILGAPGDDAIRLRLEAGMGILCNNVLHARTTFADDPAAPRLLLRARFLERIEGTSGAWRPS